MKLRRVLTVSIVASLVVALCGCNRYTEVAGYTVTSSVKNDRADITYIDNHGQKLLKQKVKLPFILKFAVRNGEMLVLSCHGYNENATYNETIWCGNSSATMKPIAKLEGSGTDPFVCSGLTGSTIESPSDVRLRNPFGN